TSPSPCGWVWIGARITWLRPRPAKTPPTNSSIPSLGRRVFIAPVGDVPDGLASLCCTICLEACLITINEHHAEDQLEVIKFCIPRPTSSQTRVITLYVTLTN
uniref:Uncharacterized protein n=1 Tax=Oryza brachyantha TaxID=4533 RepID=J3LUB2_ORYBR